MAESNTCKVKLLTGRAGRSPRGGVIAQTAGQEVEVGVSEGHRLVETGQAEFVGKAPARPERIWPKNSPEAFASGEQQPEPAEAATDVSPAAE